MRRVLLCVVLLATLAEAKDALTWEAGTLLSQADDRACGVHGNAESVDTTCTLFTYYKVDAGPMIYTFRNARSWMWQKRFVLTINAQVHFAFRDGQAYLQDEHGKPHKVYLYAKEMKAAHLGWK